MLPDLAVGRQFDADLFAQLPAAVVYRGNRTAAFGPTSGTAQFGVLRIDNMTLKAGRAYYVDHSPVRPTGTNVGDRFKFDLRYNSAGTATTSSTEIGRTEDVLAYVANGGTTLLQTITRASASGMIFPSSDTTTGSVLLTFGRAIASGSGGTFSFTPDTGGLHLRVWDLGMDPGDTGIDL